MGCSKTVEDANYRLDLAHWHSSCFLCGVCGVGLAASTARMDFGKAAGHVLPSHVSSSSADELTISSPSSSSSLPGGVAGAGDIVKALLFCPQHAPPTSKAGFEPVSQLRQYVYLLRCALKRLCVQLKITCKYLREERLEFWSFFSTSYYSFLN